METSTKYNRYAARIPKGMGVGGTEVVGSLSFNFQGWGVFPNLDPFGQTEKGGGDGGAKIGHFSWMS